MGKRVFIMAYTSSAKPSEDEAFLMSAIPADAMEIDDYQMLDLESGMCFEPRLQIKVFLDVNGVKDDK